MHARWWLALLGVPLTLALPLLFAQGAPGNRWAQYEREMQNPVDDPPDANEKTEFAFARLRFRSPRDGWYYKRWGIDCNKSDRQFIQGFRRLTRVHARSIEQIVDIDSDEMFDWPFLYGVGVGDWKLSASQAQRLRQYFDRGGFLMVDDFHGEREWATFMAGIYQVLPDAKVVELQDNDPILNVVYDLKERIQVPGLNVVHGPGYERGGIIPHWRAVIDDKGRVIAALCFNMDLGDAWEWADLPEYPEKYASMAYRLGINYIIYSMTH
ncbi:MAG TPA: DUF4159 domain-containing protein [Bryobacteraceae bacterium]|nr:DUF4159 domain-containing protein [Bryobacteraceae bacterium]